jgi:hypothetical protein
MYGRKFGIEIEARGLSPDAFFKVLEHRPELVCSKSVRATYDYTLASRRFYFIVDPSVKFALKSDASVVSPSSEIVTSPIREDKLPIVKLLLNLLTELGMKGHSSAGIHVHVEAPSLAKWTPFWGLGSATPPPHLERDAFVSRLYTNWWKALPKIKRAWRPFKRRSSFCKMAFSRQEMNTERYLAVHTLDSTRRHTVEFRLFNSVLNYRWVCRAVRLACGMVELANRRLELPDMAPSISLEAVMEERLKGRESVL